MCNLYFYPRSPCGERRQWRRSVKLFRQFLSTLSLRRATVTVLGIQHKVGISIHALLAESDDTLLTPITGFLGFLSTLSLRRATTTQGDHRWIRPISIHALLAESDCYSFRHSASCRYFYPRSPCGERPMGLDGRFKL